MLLTAHCQHLYHRGDGDGADDADFFLVTRACKPTKEPTLIMRDESNELIYDIGGDTCDVENVVFEARATTGDVCLNSEDFDDRTVHVYTWENRGWKSPSHSPSQNAARLRHAFFISRFNKVIMNCWRISMMSVAKCFRDSGNP